MYLWETYLYNSINVSSYVITVTYESTLAESGLYNTTIFMLMYVRVTLINIISKKIRDKGTQYIKYTFKIFLYYSLIGNFYY